MSDYLDNQEKWSWTVDPKIGKVAITTDHGDHIHNLNLKDVTIGEISDNPGKVLGDAHRAAPHEYKDGRVKPAKTGKESVGNHSKGGKTGGKGGSHSLGGHSSGGHSSGGKSSGHGR